MFGDEKSGKANHGLFTIAIKIVQQHHDKFLLSSSREGHSNFIKRFSIYISKWEWNDFLILDRLMIRNTIVLLVASSSFLWRSPVLCLRNRILTKLQGKILHIIATCLRSSIKLSCIVYTRQTKNIVDRIPELRKAIKIRGIKWYLWLIDTVQRARGIFTRLRIVQQRSELITTDIKISQTFHTVVDTFVWSFDADIWG